MSYEFQVMSYEFQVMSYEFQILFINYNSSMKLIVGLGNPGEKYQNNRHNAGFMFVDYLYKNSEVVKPWKYDKYLLLEIAEVKFQAPSSKFQTILAKPQTYMNRSGEAVKKLITNKNRLSEVPSSKLQVPMLLIVHDDLDLRLGNFKIQLGVGPKVHNGINSIENTIKTNDFWRVRIGVDNRVDKRINGEEYVLQNFTSEEKNLLQNIFPKIIERLISCLKAA